MEPDKHNAFFFRFEDLRIYHKALDYVTWVHGLSRNWQGAEDLSRQFNCAAHSIAVNIAEGSGRNKTQFVYYLKMAKSSIRECIVLTTIANRRELISEEQNEDSRQYLIEMTKMVGALISSLQRSLKGSESHDEDETDLIDEFNRYNP